MKIIGTNGVVQILEQSSPNIRIAPSLVQEASAPTSASNPGLVRTTTLMPR